MKRVMLVCSSQVSVPPQKGGAIEEIVFEIAKHVSKKMEPTLVSRTPFQHEGLKCVHIGSEVKKSKIAAIIEDFFYGIKCADAIKREKPDIVHFNTTFTSLGAMLALGKERPKVVYTSHSPSWTVPDEEIGLANRIFSKMEAFVMRRADKVTAVSESMRKGIVKKAGIDTSKVLTIPNFARVDEFTPKHGKGWKKSRKIEGKIVLFVGKLTETKGVRYLIHAMPTVLKKHPDAQFVFVGGLEHEQELEENPWFKMVQELGVQGSAHFLGSVSREELPKIYASADLFVLPTLREGMPMVILEAAASGLPIVTTSISGIPEAVGTDAAIFLHRKDPNGLAYSISRVLSNPVLARKMGAASRKAALKLRKEEVLENYKNLYGLLIHNKEG